MRFFLLSFLTVALIATTTVAEDWGTIKGKIVVKGDVPAPGEHAATQDADVCGAKVPMTKQSLVVGKDGGLKYAALFLYQSRREPQKPEVHPSYAEAAKGKVIVDNSNCMFEPHLTFMRTAQTLVAKNSDTKGHNVKIDSRVNGANPLIPPMNQADLQMSGEERTPAKISCAIHPWMIGYLLVRDDPYVAITDAEGSFEIKNMPEGEWVFQFWHERVGYLADLKNADGEAVMEGRPVTVTIKVKNGETVDMGTLTIDADSLKEE